MEFFAKTFDELTTKELYEILLSNYLSVVFFYYITNLSSVMHLSNNHISHYIICISRSWRFFFIIRMIIRF